MAVALWVQVVVGGVDLTLPSPPTQPPTTTSPQNDPTHEGSEVTPEKLGSSRLLLENRKQEGGEGGEGKEGDARR